MNDWDGVTERRRAAQIADGLAKPTVEVSASILIIGFVAVILLQVASLIGHAVISSHEKQAAKDHDDFRRQISCFIVAGTQGKTGTDLLTDCGFITLGGIN